MEKENFSTLTLTAVQAALRAGEILRRGFGTTFEISSKPGRQNYVTEYDKAAEHSIISLIKEKFPFHNILAEESGYSDQSEAITWIIDPLDGTSNFAHHIPIFTISIAAFEGEVGLCGVIYQPMTHEIFIAEKGKGAYLNGTRIKVSQTKQLKDCVLVASLPYDVRSTPLLKIEQLAEIIQQGVTLRNFGSAALSLAYIASGKIDAFWMYNLYPWDLAAGQILIEEAGGKLSRYQNHYFSLQLPSNVLAANQFLHSPLLEYIHP